MIAETTRTEAAARIVDIWMGDDKTWRARLGDSDFLESGDWLRALEEADAALSVAALSPQREDIGEGEPRWRGCTIPPSGWWCSREEGHDGPCAARQEEPPAESDEPLTHDDQARIDRAWEKHKAAAPPKGVERAPSPATFASETNKDRSGKHGTETA